MSRFAIDLYRQLARQPGSLFFSPYSISAALALARAGARGQTAVELDRASPETDDDERPLAQRLRPRGVRGAPPYELSMASALWVQEGLALLPEFTSAPGVRFSLERVDFQQAEEARRRINDWAASSTRQRVRDVVPPGRPAPDTRLALVNGVYFKALWNDPFQPGLTVDGPFHAPGGEVTLRFMRREGELPYADDGEAQLLSLPYVGGETSLLVALPTRRDGLAALERGLTHARVEAWTRALKERTVDVQLPRFQFTHAFDAVEDLAELGIRLPFSSGADFSGMVATEPLRLGAVLHRAFVAVDERGTEAAATTTVEWASIGAKERQVPVRFVADHPFLFLIRHEATGCVLFMGRMTGRTR